MGRVLVVGSVNADLVVAVPRLPAPGETVTGGTFRQGGGGKGANQAVAAARAGARVRFVGAVGDDALGEEATELLEAEGIDVDGVVRTPDAATGVALIVVDEEGENAIAVAPGANALVTAEAARAAAEALGEQDVLLMNLELGDDALRAAVKAAAAASATVIVNPAPARPLPEEVLERKPLLTPNEGEVEALGGLEALASRTGAPVIVTLGAAGVRISDGTTIPAPRVRVVDTTGAGDVFSGVLAAGLADGLALGAAAERAVQAAARSTESAGARPASERLVND